MSLTMLRMADGIGGGIGGCGCWMRAAPGTLAPLPGGALAHGARAVEGAGGLPPLEGIGARLRWEQRLRVRWSVRATWEPAAGVASAVGSDSTCRRRTRRLAAGPRDGDARRPSYCRYAVRSIAGLSSDAAMFAAESPPRALCCQGFR